MMVSLLTPHLTATALKTVSFEDEYVFIFVRDRRTFDFHLNLFTPKCSSILNSASSFTSQEPLPSHGRIGYAQEIGPNSSRL